MPEMVPLFSMTYVDLASELTVRSQAADQESDTPKGTSYLFVVQMR